MGEKKGKGGGGEWEGIRIGSTQVLGSKVSQSLLDVRFDLKCKI